MILTAILVVNGSEFFYTKGDSFYIGYLESILNHLDQLKQINPNTRAVLLIILSIDSSRVFFSL